MGKAEVTELKPQSATSPNWAPASAGVVKRGTPLSYIRPIMP